MPRSKPTLCLDFDGVAHSYTSGWIASDIIPDPPTPGFVDWLVRADFYFAVSIYSSRSHQPGGIEAMRAWLWKAIEEHFDIGFAGNPKDVEYANALMARIQFPTHKPSAMVSIDDRALTFTGDWRDFEPQDLTDFQPWNKKPKPGSSGSIAVWSHSKHPIRRFLTGLKWVLWGPR